VGQEARVVLAVRPEVDDREAVEAGRTQLGEQLAVAVLDEAGLERPRQSASCSRRGISGLSA
jgi:hypothetical protein